MLLPMQYNVGDHINNFEVISVQAVDDYKSNGILLRHKSGFEVYALLNDDRECFFCYTIYTPPTNNTGVFHILEHTVLTGSQRYPVRDPFMTMMRNSCNTFLNAMTGPDRTYYPAASPVKKDFDNIFNVYTDAVFAPLLRKESFMQEGIRLSNKGDMHFEGVVFSEMQGDVSQHASVVASAVTRPLFENDSPYSYEFGGNPPDICTLSYDEFVSTYKKHYVPANTTLFLYGDLDLEEKLAFLDTEYLQRDQGEKIKRIEESQKWDRPRFFRTTSNADDGALSSTAMVSWLLSGSEDPDVNTELSLIVDLLLATPGSPLYKAIIDSGLGSDISNESGMSDSYRNLIFSVGIDGVEEKNASKVESYIISSLEQIVKEGFDPIDVETCLRRQEFSLQEIPSGLSQGYRLFFSRIDKGWAYGKNPSDMLKIKDELTKIRAKLEENPRYLEAWIETNILASNHRLLSLIVMDPSTQRKMDAEIEAMVNRYKDSYSEKEEEDFDAFELSSDSKENIEKLPRLTSEDIPNIDITIDHKVDDHLVSAGMLTAGIVYADLAFDVSDFTYEELQYLSVLSRLLLMTNVDDMDYSTFLSQIRFVTGNVSFFLEAGKNQEREEKDFLIFRFKSLREHYKEALNIIIKLFYKADLHDISRIKATLADFDSEFKSSVSRSGHQYAFLNAASSISSASYTNELISGVTFWSRIKEMQQDIESLPEKLIAVYEKVFSRSRLTFHVSTDEEKLESVKKETNEFISKLQSASAVCENPKHFVAEGKNRAYTFSTPVSYDSLAFKSANQDSKKGAGEKFVLSLVAQNTLWALIREKGGAYGGGVSLDTVEEYIFFYTYRDPRIDGSIEDFRKAIEIEDFTPEMLEDGRVAVLSRDVRPLGPAAKALIDFRRCIYKYTDYIRRKRKELQLDLTLEDLEKYRKELLERMDREDKAITVFTDQKNLATTKLKFEARILPFS